MRGWLLLLSIAACIGICSSSENASVVWQDLGEFVSATPDLITLPIPTFDISLLLNLGPDELWRSILNFGDPGLFWSVANKLLKGAIARTGHYAAFQTVSAGS